MIFIINIVLKKKKKIIIVNQILFILKKLDKNI